jgi:hypothetical protein
VVEVSKWGGGFGTGGKWAWEWGTVRGERVLSAAGHCRAAGGNGRDWSGGGEDTRMGGHAHGPC